MPYWNTAHSRMANTNIVECYENSDTNAQTQTQVPTPRGDIKRRVDVRRESHLSFQESEVARLSRLNQAFRDAIRMGGGHPSQEVEDVCFGDSNMLVLLRPCLLRLPRALHRSLNEKKSQRRIKNLCE